MRNFELGRSLDGVYDLFTLFTPFDEVLLKFMALELLNYYRDPQKLGFKKRHVSTTLFENHRKSLIQHCERSELRLRFEWTKAYLKCQKWSILASF